MMFLFLLIARLSLIEASGTGFYVVLPAQYVMRGLLAQNFDKR